MVYKNGKDILPPGLLTELQKYIQGEIIYIPKEESARTAWGVNSGSRIALRERNNEIYNLHHEGISVSKIAVMYCLSEDTIRKVISKINHEKYTNIAK